MINPKLLTLTLKKDSTKEQFVAKDQDILNLFHQLRRILKDEYHIIIESFELVIEHPNHLHAIIDSRYIPFKLIQQIWKELTNDQSYYVNIKAIKVSSPRNVARYVTKYVTKMDSWNGCNPDSLKYQRIKQSWNVQKSPPPPSICHQGMLEVIEPARRDEDWTNIEVPSSPGPPEVNAWTE